ncbi:MAG TPA: TonB family protein [Limnochordales bacterium]
MGPQRSGVQERTAGVGRMEPFVALSLLLHVLVLPWVARWWEMPRLRIPVTQGVVVQVLPVPAPAPQPAVAQRPAAQAPSPSDAPRAAVKAPLKVDKPSPSLLQQALASRRAPSERRLVSPSPAAPARTTAQARPPAQPAAESPAAAADAPPVAQAEVDQPPAPAAPPAPSAAPASPAAPVASAAAAAPPPLTTLEALIRGPVRLPAYPKDALSQRAQGRVVVQVVVGPDGLPREAEVVTSSGRHDFDSVATYFVRRLAFNPPASGAGYRVALEVAFALRDDPQGRLEPSVELRAVGAPQPLPEPAEPAGA